MSRTRNELASPPDGLTGTVRRPSRQVSKGDPLWYKDAIIYEVHVRAFLDSNADGIGDFPGLTQKLDYLQDLGVTAIWLLPFYPSPLKDDGYDIADYYSINPIYGTLRDFKRFLAEAHARRLRVITELVVNHTSDQHGWFQRSRRAKAGQPWRDFYVWSDTPERYREARIIFRDFETSNWTWDPVAGAYYWHRFYSHQPDLNYDNPLVHREIGRVLDFWLDLGVDGLRLDAVPYLYERDGTSCENLPETHAYLRTLRRHVDGRYGDRMLLAEANQWPEEAVTYFGAGTGDECHMAFHFPLMPRLFMAVRMEDRVPIVDILEQTPAIPETAQWALFLRNHDELTLEMVTDEERDYMYRVYANDTKARINLGIRRRLAPLLGNDRKRIELLHLLLFSLPGTPVLYYGDEIGMGDNIYLGDRNGVRTPMQWRPDRNAGFSQATPQALYFPVIVDPEYHYEATNVEAQLRNPSSLIWWMKRTLNLRKRHKAFGRGTLEFLHPANRKILAFVRRWQEESILVVANLSRFTQPVQLDLAPFRGMVPVELFGRNKFPTIGEAPYFLTLGPHAAFWFALKPAAEKNGHVPEPPPHLVVAESWEHVVTSPPRAILENFLVSYLPTRRWFRGKARPIKSVQVQDRMTVGLTVDEGAAAGEAPGTQPEVAALLVLAVDYVEGDPEEYLLPVAFASGERAADIERTRPQSVIGRVTIEKDASAGLLHEAIGDERLSRVLLQAIARRRTFEGDAGSSITSAPTRRGGREPAVLSQSLEGLRPAPAAAEQSNSNINFGDKYLLKIFRKIETGTNPDLEIGRFLTERRFAHSPAVAGALEYRRHAGEPATVGVLTEFVAQGQDAFSYSRDTVSRYFDRVRTLPGAAAPPGTAPADLVARAWLEPPEETVGLIGTFVELARLLGKRTADLHMVLASDNRDPAFAPETFTPFYQRSLFQSMRNQAVRTFDLLRAQLPALPRPIQPDAERALAAEGRILSALRAIHRIPIPAMRIRCHGDFHLGQVLYTGKDFYIIDFEGEPARPLGERRIKRCPLRDVAGMIRSFDYLVHVALKTQLDLGVLQPAQLESLEPWTAFWQEWVSAFYLRAYLERLKPAGLLPDSQDQVSVLLNAHLLEKALYEIAYELNNRPAWVGIPLRGILRLVQPQSSK